MNVKDFLGFLVPLPLRDVAFRPPNVPQCLTYIHTHRNTPVHVHTLMHKHTNAHMMHTQAHVFTHAHVSTGMHTQTLYSHA